MPAAQPDTLLVGELELIRYLLERSGLTPESLGLDTLDADYIEAAVSALLVRKKVRYDDTWSDGRMLLAAQQLLFRDAGADPGAIDGLLGPDTLHALERWQNIARDRVVPKAVVKKMGKPTVWPREKDAERFYGRPGIGHTMLELPYPMKLAWDTTKTISRMNIHSKCAESAGRVLTRVKEHYGMKEIARLGLDLFGGCYNDRPKRGGTTKSMHAYACAIDFDPTRNQLRWGRDRARLALPSCTVWWEIWEDEGWVSLGRERNYDWMHVQAAAL